MKRGLHLFCFLTHSPINHTAATWSDPADRRLESMASFKEWQHLARVLERGRFDGVFFADVLGGYDVFKDRMDEAVRYGVWWPTHDPLPVLAAMGAVTEHLGLVTTLSLAGTHPYLAVRTLSTLDYMSGGRVGWNMVTGGLRGEHRALGAEQMDHDERYDRGDEYIQACQQLWEGVGAGAVVTDRERAELADPALVRRVSFRGKYISLDAVPPTFRSPQGKPVLFQAGTSERGLAFAIRHADVIFAIQSDPAGRAAYLRRLRDTAAAAGQPSPKVVLGLQIILGDTEAAARQAQRDLADRIPLEASLSRLSGSFGVDFSTFDLDQPIVEIETKASRGLMASVASAENSRSLTVRQAATLWGRTAGMPQIVGTPEQVADALIELWTESGCDGFNITPTLNPSSVEALVDEVVPILQRRGAFRTDYPGNTLRATLGI